MHRTAVVWAYVVALAAGSSVNYCGSRMCANTNAHTFCQFPEGPSPHCVGYINAQLTIEEKSRLIARLNRRRNEAASGRMRGLPSAGDMLKLRWVEELAREAQRWADQCRPPRTIEEHDACRNLYSLTVGQCVASVVGEAPGLRVESMVDIWYMQSMLYKGNVTFYVPPTQNGSFYGDFGQIIWARSYMVGCGRSRFMTPWQGRLRSVERLVCNLAPLGPPPGRPLWSPAGPAATCPPRSLRDTTLTALCDYQRNSKQITANGSAMTFEENLILNTIFELEDYDKLDYLGSLDELYLTKVAIATMKNTVTTQVYYNSMQRRDVVEVIEDVDPHTNVSTTVLPGEVIPPSNTTLPPDKDTIALKTPKTTKKKVSLIGRPKTYNMEDLTDFDEKTENNAPVEDIPKKEKEFYADYDFLGAVDDNVSTSDLTNLTEIPSDVNIVVSQDVLRDAVTQLYQNTSLLYGGSLEALLENARVVPDITSSSESESAVVDSGSTQIAVQNNSSTKDEVDEYLSDPETVRELQEALERIERDMQPKMEKQGKVRRELRETPEDQESSPEPNIEADPRYAAELERNKTLERGPMFNMVLKYMPYLKQYEGGLLPKSNEESGASIVKCSSLFLVLVLACL